MGFAFGRANAWRIGLLGATVIALVPRPGTAQAQASISDLRARFVAIRFFPSPAQYPNRAVRQYTTRFDSAAVRYVGLELEFQFDPPGRVVEFPVSCQYFLPDGTVMTTLDMTSQAQPSWSDLIRTSAWGNATRSIYRPGRYRVRCTSGAMYLGEAGFEVVRAAPEIAAANAKFASLRFFETPLRPMVERDARKYHQSFEAAGTRSIGIEIMFDAPPPGRVVEFPVECRILGPDGSELAKVDLRSVIQPEWTGVINAAAWGWEEAGKWARGVYRTSCWSEERWIADGRFEIT